MENRKVYLLGVFILIAIVFGAVKLWFANDDTDKPLAFGKYNGSIKIAVEENYRPFSYIDENGNLVGFDHDISLAICAELNLNCTVVPLPFPDIPKALKEDQVQVAVSGLSITEERKTFMAFSEPYYHSLTHFISNNPNVGNMRFGDERFRAQIRIGVQDNSMQLDYVKEKMADHPENIFTYAGYESLAQALLSQQVDVVLLDGFAAFDLLNRDPSVYAVGSVDHNANENSEIDTLRIAVALPNAREIENINYALSQLRQRGSYQKIAAKYFPFISE